MTDPIRVRLLANWCDSRYLCELFNPMTTDGNYEWAFEDLAGEQRRLRITWDAEAPDYWAVINSPPPEDEGHLDRARTVVFHMEPLMWTKAMRPRWGSWAAPSPRSFLQVRDHRRYRNSNDWWVGLSHRELSDGPPPHKVRVMAACVSEKYFDPGHRKRVDFLRFLDERDLDLDIYGYPGHGFRRHRSPTPPHDKSAALLPYRYYFDAENNASPNFFTEKIVDCLLAETLCFYWGCPNLDSFFDPRAFIRLELEDFEADLQVIRDAIAADEWSARIPYIKAEKRRILDDYGFFPTLASAIDPARRRRRWAVGGTDPSPLDRWIGEKRCGVFAEISDRAGAPEESETLDVERRLDWSGLCLESDWDRVRAARGVRDCTVALDDGEASVDAVLARNAIPPTAIDWLNLAVRTPHELVRHGGRLDPERVRANVISMPLAGADEVARCRERLAACGYETRADLDGAGAVMVRPGSDDVFGFYHLFAANTWREVLAEQVRRLQGSGLADATRRIFATVVGPDFSEARRELEDAFGPRLEVVAEGDEASDAERPVLQFARWFCEHGEPLARGVWYVHSKGVSSRNAANPHVADWRRLMEHFVIEGWHDCVDALRDHDVCGVNWHQHPEPHFSGNFWWATPRYVARLSESIGERPFDPEGWIGSAQPRVRCLHESGVDHYVTAYPEMTYIG